jgi:hypothetical protein
MSESSEIPDTAMATGNDEGEPGHPDTRPLAKDERKLLKELRKSADGSGEPAVEDGPEMAAAAGDDAPLPAATGGDGQAGDGLDPEFTDR